MSKSKRRFHAQEAVQLKKRLTHLEEETNMLKQEMLRNITEKKTLFNDVYRQMKLVQSSLHPENQTFGYKFCQDGGRLDGLSQVLYKDCNPSVFIRGGLGAISVTDPCPVEVMLSTNIKCIKYNK